MKNKQVCRALKCLQFASRGNCYKMASKCEVVSGALGFCLLKFGRYPVFLRSHSVVFTVDVYKNNGDYLSQLALRKFRTSKISCGLDEETHRRFIMCFPVVSL